MLYIAKQHIFCQFTVECIALPIDTAVLFIPVTNSVIFQCNKFTIDVNLLVQQYMHIDHFMLFYHIG